MQDAADGQGGRVHSLLQHAGGVEPGQVLQHQQATSLTKHHRPEEKSKVCLSKSNMRSTFKIKNDPSKADGDVGMAWYALDLLPPGHHL